MHDNVKIAFILCATAIIITGLHIYFSPFQTCVRGGKVNEVRCAALAAGDVKVNGTVSVDGSVSLEN